MTASNGREGTVVAVRETRRAKIAVASAVLAGVIVSLVVVAGTSSQDNGISEETLVAELTRCTETGNQIRQTCLENLIIRAADAGVYQPLSVAMGEMSVRDGNFRGDCHAASHKAGEQLLSIYSKRATASGGSPDIADAAVAAFADLDTEVCGSSVAHGLAEAFAAQPQPLQRWRTLLRGCETLQAARPEMQHGCAHGVGHALVIATSKAKTDADLTGVTIGRLIEFCEKNSTSGTTSGTTSGEAATGEAATSGATAERRGSGGYSSLDLVKQSCAYGVMMGAFAPVTEQMVNLDAPAELVSHCNSAYQASTREGCFGGAGFALGMNLTTLQKTPEMLSEMLHACEGKGFSDGTTDAVMVRVCREQVLLHIRSNISESEGDFTDVVVDRCASLEAGFGRDQAVSCLAGLRLVEGTALFDQIVSVAGELGAEAERSLQGQ